MFKSMASAVVLLFASSLGLRMAHAEYGFDVQTTKTDMNEGVTASDFYSLIGNGLGSNFGSLTMIFGGCYAGDFASGLANSVVGKSGKPVAVLTATDRKERGQCTPAGINGAPFFSGVFGGFVDLTGSGGVTNPVSSASSAGEASVKNFTDKEVIKKKLNESDKVIVPPSQPDHEWVNGGDKITLNGKDKDHKHAILFMGKPQTVFDWNDLINAYQTLVDAGFVDIQVFFGTGQTAKDGFPALTKDDFTPGISVQRDADTYQTPRPIKVLTEITKKDGKTTGLIPKAADFEHLKGAIRTWKAISKTAGHADDQFFIAVGTHSTNNAMPRVMKDLDFTLATPSSGPLGPRFNVNPRLPGAAPRTPQSEGVPVSWDGFYAGLNGGIGFGESRWDEDGGGTGRFRVNGPLAGATAGFNVQTGKVVAGIEGDINAAAVSGDTSKSCSSPCETSNSWLASLRGRVGFDPPRSLFYITGGLAIGAVRANVGTFPGSSATNVGWAAGAGAEFALSTNLTGKLEFLHVDLGSGHCTPATCGGNATIPLQFELLRAGLNYHFNWAGR